MATASDKGTLIRLFSTEDATAIQEVRRGSDKAEIYSISFDRYSKYLACSSDKGTIHIFAVNKNGGKINLANEDEESKKEEGVVQNKKHM